jgi:fructoselysine 6-kinase
MALANRRRIAGIGDNCIDIYVPPTSRSAVGGQAVNVAVHWRRVGWASEYYGAVGNDANGTRVVNTVARQGVDVGHVQRLDGATGVTHFRRSPKGDRVLLAEDQGVCANYAPTAADLDLLASCTFVHGANLPAFRQIMRALSERGAQTSYDFSETAAVDDLQGIDIAFYSCAEGTKAAQALAKAAVGAGAKLAVVTCGAQGSLAYDGIQYEHVPALPARPVDTCGAGDSFVAAFVSRLLEGAPLSSCLKAGAALAAETCGYLGAWPQELEAV